MELFVLPFLMLGAMGFFSVDLGIGPSTRDDDFDDADQNRRLGGDDDSLLGGAGDDRLFGMDGSDQIAGGPGDDLIVLGDGADQNFVSGNDSPDQVAGNDTIRGGGGSDTLVDFLGADQLYGGASADVLDATDRAGDAAQPDTLFGGAGLDVLAADTGDQVYGGGGLDSFYLSVDAASDDPVVIHDYEADEPLEISVPLAFVDQQAALVETDAGVDVRLAGHTLAHLAGVKDAGDVNITLIAADIADHTVTPGVLILGTQGDDQIAGTGGDDAIFVGRGDDVVDAGAGDDYISLRTARPFEPEGELGWGSNTVDAGAGADRVLGGFSDDVVRGGAGSDLLIGLGGHDDVSGGRGDDVIDAIDAETGQGDTVLGGQGADRLLVDDGDLATGGSGADHFAAVDYQSGDAPVRITDFQPGFDTLSATVTGTNLAVSFNASGANTEVLVGQRVVFVLQDVSVDAAQTAQITVSRSL